MERLLNDLIAMILTGNLPIMGLAIAKRAKFEGWLKFDLAEELAKIYTDTEVEKSVSISGKTQFVDFFSNNSLIELKTISTNYRTPGCPYRVRPITDNINSIINDITKLRSITGPDDKYIAFVMYPLDSNTPIPRYTVHVNRVIAALSPSTRYVQSIVTIGSVDFLIFTAKV